MKPPLLEKDIQRLVLDWLAANRIFHYRNNSGAFVFPATDGHARRFIRAGETGSPDIVAVVNGRYVGIEVKRPKGKQSPAQKDFQERLEKAGGIYLLITSLDELAQCLIPPKKSS